MKVSGIYLITNIITNKHYVGQSINCLSRFSKHKSLLRKNIHSNPYLQSSWNKYGEENFIFDIIDEVDKELLISLENWWCNILNTHNRINGYNLATTNNNEKIQQSLETINKIRLSNIGKKVSEETKEKLRIINIGKKVSEETKEKLKNNKNNKKIDVYNLYGIFVETIKSARECSRIYNCDVKSILKCVKGEYNVVKKFIFKEHNDYLTNEELYLRKDKCLESKKVKVIGFYLDGTLIGEFDSYYEAEKSTGYSSYKISLCVRGLQKRVKDTIWKLSDIN